ncbi:DNA-directed DNA polymerase [Tanacetum coccineum]
MREDFRILIILERPFLATARAMIYVFNKKITLRVGNEEVIFDIDQSIKGPPVEDDECYGIDYLDTTIHLKTQELLEDDQLESFLVNNLEESIDQSDLESCESQKTQGPKRKQNAPLYSASANEIDERRLELKDLPSHLEYAYLKGNESCPVIISSKLSEKEKISLLQVLEKRKGTIAWKDIKGISPSFCIHKILLEESFKPVIQPQRRLNPKAQDVVKNKIVRLLDSGLIYPITDSPWASPIYVIPKKGKMTVVLNNNNELIPSRTVIGWRMPLGICNASTTFQRCMTAIFHDMVEDFMEVFMDDFLVFGNSFDQCLGNLDKILARSLENPNMGELTEEETADEFPDEHLMILKPKLNDEEPWLRGDKDFKNGDKVLLFNSCLKLHLGKLKSKWSDDYTEIDFSAEAEYRGVANVVAETCWLRNLLRKLYTLLSFATLVYCDYVNAVYLSCNLVQHQRTKHIEIDIHFISDLVAADQVRVLHVPSLYQFVDIFTKGLSSALFEEFRSSLSVCCPPALTAREC